MKDEREGILEGQENATRVALEGRASPSIKIRQEARRRLLGGAFTLVGLLCGTYLVPGLEGLRPWQMGEGYVPFWNLIGRELLGQGADVRAKGAELAEFEQIARRSQRSESTSAETPTAATPIPPTVTEATDNFPPYVVQATDPREPKVGLENPSALTHYFGQLTLTELRRPGAITRASHWGDSVLGGDGLTRVIRERLQARFGDAGHGFHALSRYNLAYLHRGVRFADRGGWFTCEIIFKCEPDGHYGYAGVSSRSSAGGTSRWRTAKEGYGSRVSRFELWYATRPKGGRFQIKVDDEVVRVVDTASDEPGDRVATVNVEDGAHGFEVRAIGGGLARGYGVVLERDEPGVVWDELSLIGAFTQRLDYQDPEHIARQVRRREVDLMVFMFGGNDVQRQKMDLYRTMQPYEDEYNAVIQKFRKGKPEASCLIMSLVDHGKRVGKHGIETLKIVPKLVESQRKVALQQGCAFFDTFAAMGGDGSIGRWYHASPRLANADFAHPTVRGQEVIAELFTQALLSSYVDFRKAQAGNPLPAVSRASEKLDPAGKPQTAGSESGAVDAESTSDVNAPPAKDAAASP